MRRGLVQLVPLANRALDARLLAEPHEHDVDGQAVEPGRKSGFTPEGVNLAKELHENFLRDVFRVGLIP
jgi:hypothetical protein